MCAKQLAHHLTYYTNCKISVFLFQQLECVGYRHIRAVNLVVLAQVGAATGPFEWPVCFCAHVLQFVSYLIGRPSLIHCNKRAAAGSQSSQSKPRLLGSHVKLWSVLFAVSSCSDWELTGRYSQVSPHWAGTWALRRSWRHREFELLRGAMGIVHGSIARCSEPIPALCARAFHSLPPSPASMTEW